MEVKVIAAQRRLVTVAVVCSLNPPSRVSPTVPSSSSKHGLENVSTSSHLLPGAWDLGGGGHYISIPPAVTQLEAHRGSETGLRWQSRQVGEERVGLVAAGSRDACSPARWATARIV